MQPRTAFALVTLLLSAACASGGDTGHLGNYDALSPSLSTVSGEERPTHLNINLGAPGYVTVLFVIPARGASVIYPGDTTTNNYFGAGAHQVTTAFSDQSKLIDTTYLPRLNADSTARTRRNTNRPSPFDPSELERAGYLLMIVSQDSIPIADLQRRVSGVTIPIGDDEALNAVAKLVTSTTRGNKPWSGYYEAIVAK